MLSVFDLLFLLFFIPLHCHPSSWLFRKKQHSHRHTLPGDIVVALEPNYPAGISLYFGVADWDFLEPWSHFWNFEKILHILYLVQMLTIPLAGGVLNFTIRALVLNVSPYRRNWTSIQKCFRTIILELLPALLKLNLNFNRILGWPVCTLKFEKCWFNTSADIFNLASEF